MAITFAAIYNTPYSSAFLATHDGAAGDAATLGNVALLANCAAGTPIRAVASAAYAAQADARIACGQGATATPALVTMKIDVIPRGAGATTGWAVDANVAAGLLVLDATAIGASTCVIVLTRRHSMGR